MKKKTTIKYKQASPMNYPFGGFPMFDQYKDITSKWDNYWKSDNLFGQGTQLTPGGPTYTNPQDVLYNTVQQNQDAANSQQGVRDYADRTGADAWGNKALDYTYKNDWDRRNPNATDADKARFANYSSFFDKYENGKATPGWDGTSTLEGGAPGSTLSDYNAWKVSREGIADQAKKEWASNNMQYNTMNTASNKQMGAALTNTAGGIFSGLNYQNAYKEEAPINLEQGFQGVEYAQTGKYIGPSTSNYSVTSENPMHTVGAFAGPLANRISQTGNNPLANEFNLVQDNNDVMEAVLGLQSLGRRGLKKMSKNKIIELLKINAKPIASVATQQGLQNSVGSWKHGGNMNTTGYTPNTPTMNNHINTIPGGNIEMKSDFPIVGIANNGFTKLMQPGEKHKYPFAKNVNELPLRGHSTTQMDQPLAQFGGLAGAASNLYNELPNIQADYLQEISGGQNMYATADFNRRMLGNNSAQTAQVAQPIVPTNTSSIANSIANSRDPYADGSIYQQGNPSMGNNIYAMDDNLDEYGNPTGASGQTSASGSNFKNEVYSLKGDKTYEYSKDANGNWLTRRKGSKQGWTNINNTEDSEKFNKAKAIDELNKNAQLGNVNPIKTSSGKTRTTSAKIVNTSAPLSGGSIQLKYDPNIGENIIVSGNDLTNTSAVDTMGINPIQPLASPYISPDNSYATNLLSLNSPEALQKLTEQPQFYQQNDQYTAPVVETQSTPGMSTMQKYKQNAEVNYKKYSDELSTIQGDKWLSPRIKEAKIKELKNKISSTQGDIKRFSTADQNINLRESSRNQKILLQKESLAKREQENTQQRLQKELKTKEANIKNYATYINKLDTNITNYDNLRGEDSEGFKPLNQDGDKILRSSGGQYKLKLKGKLVDKVFNNKAEVLAEIKKRTADANSKYGNSKTYVPTNQYGGGIPLLQFGGEINGDHVYPIHPITEEFTEIQTEGGETIFLPDGTIVNVKADEKHKNMSKDTVTDILPQGAYVFSADPKMKFSVNSKIGTAKIDDMFVGQSVFEYKENEITPGPEKIFVKDVFFGNSKKELTTAEISNNIKKKFELRDDKNDFFIDRAVKENKEQRVEYLSILKAMNEFKKPKSKRDVPQAQYGMNISGYDVQEAGVGGFFNKIGNAAQDWGVGIADGFGNSTGLYDINNNSYKTKFGKNVSGFANKMSATTGQIGRAIGATAVPGLGSALGMMPQNNNKQSMQEQQPQAAPAEQRNNMGMDNLMKLYQMGSNFNMFNNGGLVGNYNTIDEAQYGMGIPMQFTNNGLDGNLGYSNKAMDPFMRMDNNKTSMFKIPSPNIPALPRGYESGGEVPQAQLGTLLRYTVPGAYFVSEHFANKAKKKQDKINVGEMLKRDTLANAYQQNVGNVAGIDVGTNLATYAASLNVPTQLYDDMSSQSAIHGQATNNIRAMLNADKYSAQNSLGSAGSLARYSGNNMNQGQYLAASQQGYNNQVSNINSQLAQLEGNSATTRMGLTGQGTANYQNAINARNAQIYNANVTGLGNVGRSAGTGLANIGNTKYSLGMERLALERQHRDAVQAAKDQVINKWEGALGAAGQIGLTAATGGFGAIAGGASKQAPAVNNSADNPYGFDGVKGYDMSNYTSNPYNYQPPVSFSMSPSSFGPLRYDNFNPAQTSPGYHQFYGDSQFNPYGNSLVPGGNRQYPYPGEFNFNGIRIQGG